MEFINFKLYYAVEVDTSKGFEKTDALIEKSVNVVFEVFDNTRLDTILDLGKFLWKEKFAHL